MIGGYPYFQQAGGRPVACFSSPEKQTGFLWQNMGEKGQMPLKKGQTENRQGVSKTFTPARVSVEATPFITIRYGKAKLNLEFIGVG